ncbi:MAG: hypothetical protein AAB774_02700 [Patescibacteria group bacterium]
MLKNLTPFGMLHDQGIVPASGLGQVQTPRFTPVFPKRNGAPSIEDISLCCPYCYRDFVRRTGEEFFPKASSQFYTEGRYGKFLVMKFPGDSGTVRFHALCNNHSRVYNPKDSPVKIKLFRE